MIRKTLLQAVVMIALCSLAAPVAAQVSTLQGPFGLRWGMSGDAIEKTLPVREKKIEGRFSYYDIGRVLGPYPPGTEHLLVVDREYGLQAASAVISIKNDDGKATRTISQFRTHAQTIRATFGDPIQLGLTYDASLGEKNIMSCFVQGCAKATGSWARSGVSAGIDVIGENANSAVVAIRFWGPRWGDAQNAAGPGQ